MMTKSSCHEQAKQRNPTPPQEKDKLGGILGQGRAGRTKEMTRARRTHKQHHIALYHTIVLDIETGPMKNFIGTTPDEPRGETTPPEEPRTRSDTDQTHGDPMKTIIGTTITLRFVSVPPFPISLVVLFPFPVWFVCLSCSPFIPVASALPTQAPRGRSSRDVAPYLLGPYSIWGAL